MAWTLPQGLHSLADRIPDETRKALSPAELYARCQYADELTRKAFDMPERALIGAALSKVEQVLKAMTPAELASSELVLTKGLAVAPQGMAASYGTALANLKRANPQPPSGYRARAEAEVNAANTIRPQDPAQDPWRADGSYAVGRAKSSPSPTTGPDNMIYKRGTR